MEDGREVSVPLEWYPTLERASARQRGEWELLGPGTAIHWEALDLDLSVQAMIQGIREGVPRPPEMAGGGRRRR